MAIIDEIRVFQQFGPNGYEFRVLDSNIDPNSNPFGVPYNQVALDTGEQITLTIECVPESFRAENCGLEKDIITINTIKNGRWYICRVLRWEKNWADSRVTVSIPREGLRKECTVWINGKKASSFARFVTQSNMITCEK